MARKDLNREFLQERIYNIPEVKRLISERSERITTRINEFNQLGSAQSLEPHLKVSGGTYKRSDGRIAVHRQDALKRIHDEQRLSNTKIESTISNELDKNEEYKELDSLKDYDIQELLDEQMQKSAAHSPHMDFTNAEINEFLEQHSFLPEPNKQLTVADKFTRNERDILMSTWDEREQEIKESKTKDLSRNKDIDLEIDR